MFLGLIIFQSLPLIPIKIGTPILRQMMYAYIYKYTFCQLESVGTGILRQPLSPLPMKRGTMLMAISNKLGHLLLSTGNKSELAVGYCTLYGDMNGGLAVLADVPKTSVYRIARFINRDREIIPERIITKPPSAELKPDQRDQDDLPPYEILDEILTAYIEDNKAPDEIMAMGFEPSIVNDIIARVDRNEYKRNQSPPGLKVTTKSFGYGRRYPIAQRYRFP
jgi:NAD+ synthase (glutamine-hydrolysing)